jgi:hypothetical protein
MIGCDSEKEMIRQHAAHTKCRDLKNVEIKKRMRGCVSEREMIRQHAAHYAGHVR